MAGCLRPACPVNHRPLNEAYPARGSVYRVAECGHCGEQLRDDGNGWHHAYTGAKTC